MDLLHGVHPAVGFCEQPFNVVSVFRTESHSDAERDNVAATNVASGLDCSLVQAIRLFLGSFSRQSRSGNDEFISAHARDVVVTAAYIFEAGGELTQQFVSLKVSEGVID